MLIGKNCCDKSCKGGKSQRVTDEKKNSDLCPSVSTNGKEQCLVVELVQVPWGHHIQIISKCKGDREKAFFYVWRTIQNGWSRNVLLNWLSTDLYEREGLGQTNFVQPISLSRSRTVSSISEMGLLARTA